MRDSSIKTKYQKNISSYLQHFYIYSTKMHGTADFYFRYCVYTYIIKSAIFDSSTYVQAIRLPINIKYLN